MKKRRFIILLTMIIFSFIGCQSSKSTTVMNSQLSQKEKIADFEYMHNTLKDNYPYFEVNKRLNGVDWLTNKNNYIDKIKSTQSDKDFFNALQDILAELNNGHVSMLDKNFYYYAISIYEKDQKANEAWLKQLKSPRALERYSNMPDTGNTSQFLANSITNNNVKTDIIQEGKAAYLSIHTFNTFNIDGDMKIIGPFLKSIKDYRALIIDIRGNGGGDDRYWCENLVPMLINKPLSNTDYIVYRGGDFTEQFIKSREGYGYEKLEPILNISKEGLKNLPPEVVQDFKYYKKDVTYIEPKNSIVFKGKIYLLVDRDVFSSSEAFATFSKSTGFGTLVGERTGGDGIGDDPAICILPNSGYAFRFPKQMGLTYDGTCDFECKTEPDITVQAKKGVDLAYDEAVQTVLKLIN